MAEGDAKDTVKISGEVSKELLDALLELAKRRGVSANTVLQQAIANEKFLDDQQAQGSSLLIEKPNKTFRKLIFAR